MEPAYITEFKGDYRVRCWGSGIRESYCFMSRDEAIAKYMELTVKQALRTAKLNRVVFEELFDFGGEDMLAFVTMLDSRKCLKLSEQAEEPPSRCTGVCGA